VSTMETLSFQETVGSLLWESTDALFVSRLTDGRVLHANDAGAELFGISQAQLIGSTSLELGLWADPGDRAVFAAALRERGKVDGYPVAVRVASGETRLLHVSSRLTVMDGDLVAVTVARDTTEQSSTERLLSAQQAAATAVSEAGNLDEATRRVLTILGERLGWDLTGFWIADDRAGVLVYQGSWASPLVDMPDVLRLSPPVYQRDEGIIGWVWRNAAADWVEDLRADRRVLPVIRSLAVPLRSALVFPVRRAGRILGVIGCYTGQARERDDALIEGADAIGRMLGLRIERR
jgi:PAS domain S-box-containing protein